MKRKKRFKKKHLKKKHLRDMGSFQMKLNGGFPFRDQVRYKEFLINLGGGYIDTTDWDGSFWYSLTIASKGEFDSWQETLAHAKKTADKYTKKGDDE